MLLKAEDKISAFRSMAAKEDGDIVLNVEALANPENLEEKRKQCAQCKKRKV